MELVKEVHWTHIRRSSKIDGYDHETTKTKTCDFFSSKLSAARLHFGTQTSKWGTNGSLFALCRYHLVATTSPLTTTSTHTHSLSFSLLCLLSHTLFLSLFYSHTLWSSLSFSLSHTDTYTHTISLSLYFNLSHTHTHSISILSSITHTHTLFRSFSLYNQRKRQKISK